MKYLLFFLLLLQAGCSCSNNSEDPDPTTTTNNNGTTTTTDSSGGTTTTQPDGGGGTTTTQPDGGGGTTTTQPDGGGGTTTTTDQSGGGGGGSTTTTSTTSTTTTTMSDIVEPSDPGPGTVDANCTTNSTYNACTFDYTDKTSFDLKANDYGVTISVPTGTTALENIHYKVDISITGKTRAVLNNNKWTDSTSGDSNYTRMQAGVYHWLMYQKAWMETNAGAWYASDKAIDVIIDTSGNVSNLWDQDNNQISLNTSLRTGIPDILTNAGFANIDFSGASTLRQNTSTHKKADAACISGSGFSCCKAYKGCLSAIVYGSADFHAYLINPDKYKTYRTYHNDNIFHNLSRCDNNYTTASDIFDNCNGGHAEDSGRPSMFGVSVYTNLWHHIYSNPKTSHQDIAKLFSEHLPLLEAEDTFELAGHKIVTKADELATTATDGFKGTHKAEYADIIEDIFQNMGLTTVTTTTTSN